MTEPNQHGPRTIEMPTPTAWPIVLSVGVTLIGMGFATSLALSVVGVFLLVIALVGWIGQLLPGRGHSHEPLPDRSQWPPAPTPRERAVEQLRPGMPGHRFRLPEKVHPISAGVKGGIVGGLLMPIPALLYSLLAGHGLWLPINLLAGMVVPDFDSRTIEQLEAFSFSALLVGVVIHVIISLSIGLIYGVLLPTLPPIPGGPVIWGGLVMPLLWTAFSYLLMGAINPALQEHVNWYFFVLSQLVYGIAASIVVIRSEMVPVRQPDVAD
jgi:hypothetical protein